MPTVNVALGDRSYPILIGPDLLADVAPILAAMPTRRAVIVSNTTVAPLYAGNFERRLRSAGVHVDRIDLPDGEQYKNWETLNRIFDVLMGTRCERSTTLIALGGGVVGDIAGFAAACYQRGMPFIQVPTTLLAQVDSSVGGKTAINHPLGKNMVGAFYQPMLVLADTRTLDTLPDRELRAGIAEVIKYGLIRDPAFVSWLEANMAGLLARDSRALAHAIEVACRHKAEIVAEDEREAGKRALLNLGHTFGHAIETGMGYGEWLHGEAVAAGTLMAAELSRQLGWITQDDVRRIERLYASAGLPLLGPHLPIDTYLELMRHDKKVREGRINLVLLRSIGDAVTSDVAGETLMKSAVEARRADA